MTAILRSRRIPLTPALLFMLFFAATVIAAPAAIGTTVGATVGADPWLRPAQAPAPADNLPNSARIELGQMLFFDPRLSRKANMSCASCHNPALAWSDGLPTATGFEMKTLVVLSNTPHPLDPAPAYQPPPVELAVGEAPPPGADDPCRTSRPETGEPTTRSVCPV